MTHFILRSVLVCALAVSSWHMPVLAKDATSTQAQIIGAYFSPPDNAAKAIIEQINASQKELLVQAYGFTHNAIAQALVQAQKRGVKVQVIMDAKSEKTNRYVVEILDRERIPYRWDGKHAIAHNKVMVIDQEVLITGSFNFTNSAQTRNAENVLILRSVPLATEYRQNWQDHWNHSREKP
ncbi:MAG: phospholipase D family protein [Betaproteobacteria bacterium]|jgi:phosphatidylserine/phosphatidylglycerophosphate/cardiolipin synthase-like enzyme|nr:phospholipase D family protein [Betaproteobacteria bacterium]NBP44165.1 phospholipase D family protein [Betaproteobacteria bacterium]